MVPQNVQYFVGKVFLVTSYIFWICLLASVLSHVLACQLSLMNSGMSH